MIIEVLICRMDGTQEIVEREVPEDYFASAEPEEAPETERNSGKTEE